MPSVIHVLSVGAFGRAAARHLRGLRPGTTETRVDGTLSGSDWPNADVTILAAWRPVSDICHRLDEAVHARGTAFISAVVDESMLTIGPTVIPRRGACWTCFERRKHQHEDWHNRRSILRAYYEATPDAGPAGYLSPWAMIAGARLCQIVEALEAGDAHAGEVWQIHMLTREITTSVVVGVHNCSRCGLQRPARDRAIAEMGQGLAYLWP